MSDDIVLRMKNVDVFHGTFQALWNVSLEVRQGEMLALIGANTAGKTTLLDAISGMLHPSNGLHRIPRERISAGSIRIRSWNWGSRRFRKGDAFFPT